MATTSGMRAKALETMVHGKQHHRIMFIPKATEKNLFVSS